MTVHLTPSYLDEPIECEWCSDRATYKIQASKYVRYACGNVYHRQNLLRLARMDGYEEQDYDVVLGDFTRRDQ